MRKLIAAASAGVSLLCLASPALAQKAASDDSPDAPAGKEEIVVTGTLIRGIAPGGSQAIDVSKAKIESTGAVDTSDLVTSIPQAGSFISFLGVRSTSNFSLMVNRPTLRYLGNTSSSTNSTLLLIDGHRLPGMGIQQSSADLDAIAAGAIERIEIVTDGGSATYGSDAVGGVMNFITRKRFDGVEVKGSVGFADNYTAYNASITAGHTWGPLSAYITYDWSKHDDTKGLDRDWSQSRDWINGVGADSACAIGNVRGTGGSATNQFALNASGGLASTTPGIGNRCDNTEFNSLAPPEIKHTAFASVVYDDGGPFSFSVKAYYVNRKNNQDTGPYQLNGVTVRNTSPFFIALPSAPTSETFFFNLSPVFGNSSRSNATLESYGITPSIKWNVGKGWQINALANFGVGKAGYLGDLINSTPINAAAAAGTFDPAHLTAATNAATLATARDWFQYGRATHNMHNVRLVADGPLFALPGGNLRAAVGVEYLYERIHDAAFSRGATAAQLASLANREFHRNVKSVFGELNIPLLGENQGIHDLSITASGRYDHYSDFGGTFNPKIGVNFAPVSWFKIRGTWGKAFQAPGVSTISEGSAPTFTALSISTRPFVNPALAVGTKTTLLTLGGTKLPLDPQKAKTWSLGFDINLPDNPNIAAGMTYYNVDFSGAIGIPPIFNPTVFYPQFKANYVTYDAGDAAMEAYFQKLAAEGASNASTIKSQLTNGDLSSVYAIMDSRTQNLARVDTSGIDFYIRGRVPTGFGFVYADISGSRILKYKQQSNPSVPLTSTLELDTTKLRLSTTLGAEIGESVRAQITWNHSGGYAIVPTAANLQQDHVGSFNIFNLFVQYKFPENSVVGKDLALSLNVDNLFDKDPPLFRGAGNSLFGVANGFTIGRLVRIGLSKKF